MAITPEFLFHLEDNMRKLVESGAEGILDELWWQDFARVFPSGSAREVLSWFIETACIEDRGLGGNLGFREMAAKQTTFTNKYAGDGLRVKRSQFLDLDGNGFDMAANWARQVGAQSQYWPQKAVSQLILAGETGLAYDGLSYFNTAHYVNPANTSVGTFANLLTSSSNGAYPGACPIDTSVSVETALNNMGSVFKYIAGIKMPNGADPRNLRPWKILVPPSLVPRAAQLTDAKFIAQIAESGKSAGSGDVSALIARLGFGTPVMAPELGASFTNGSDTTWYVLCKQAATSQLGALAYVEREPFTVRYYTGDGGGTGVDAILDRTQEYEWHVQGRNVAGYGHPYLLFKVKAA